MTTRNRQMTAVATLVEHVSKPASVHLRYVRCQLASFVEVHPMSDLGAKTP
jgi:hypothetical protein